MYDDMFVKKEVSCPLIRTPEGSEESVSISETNFNPSYVGFKGITKKDRETNKTGSKKRQINPNKFNGRGKDFKLCFEIKI